jgi:hypothetical protein
LPTLFEAVFAAVRAARAPPLWLSVRVGPGGEPYVLGLEHMPLHIPVPSTRVPGVLT